MSCKYINLFSSKGRLEISSVNGKNPNTGEYDQLFTFGGRSFSVRRADTMELVYDSGIEIAHKTALLQPHLFNNGYSAGKTIAGSADRRSDNKVKSNVILFTIAPKCILIS